MFDHTESPKLQRQFDDFITHYQKVYGADPEDSNRVRNFLAQACADISADIATDDYAAIISYVKSAKPPTLNGVPFPALQFAVLSLLERLQTSTNPVRSSSTQHSFHKAEPATATAEITDSNDTLPKKP